MAASVVLPQDLRMNEWHDHQRPSRFSPSSRDPSSLPFGSMPLSPTRPGMREDGFPQKPRLPSFSNFLSGAGRPDLKFAHAGPGLNRGTSTIQPLSDRHAAQSTLYGGRDQDPVNFAESSSQPHSLHSDPNQKGFWPHASSIPPERQLPSVFQSSLPQDRSHGNASVREEVLPGRGLCYIYGDGTVCQKYINGDAVNPHWGTTKAGKPRKRLGQACNTCREKKIKCDPSVPKCAQCRKFGRECKFDATPRTGSRQSGSAPSIGPSTYPSPIDQIQGDFPGRRESTASEDWAVESSSTSRREPRSSMQLESLLSPVSDTVDGNDDEPVRRPPAKKARTSVSPRPVSESCLSDDVMAESWPGSISSISAVPTFGWQMDPYEVDRDLTLYYLGKYFSHADSAAYHTLPEPAFTAWVKKSTTKSAADRMLLYGILALGAVFGRRSGCAAHRVLFFEIVQDAVSKSVNTYTLQLAQTQLILTLLAFSKGQNNRASDLCGSAKRTVFGLMFNTEEGAHLLRPGEGLDFGFDLATLAECRRRTFWSVYIVDCFNGCAATSVTTPYRAESHLRLPCLQAAYEKGEIPPTPFTLDGPSHSNTDATTPREELANVGLLSFLVEIATIFHEVVHFICGIAAPQPWNKYDLSRELFYQRIKSRLHAWDKQLKVHLPRHQQGEDKAEPVSGLHILYHYTALLLHRHVRYRDLDDKSINMHVTGAYEHARLMLEMVQRLSNEEKKHTLVFRFATTSPFSGFAITAALDVITAAGTLSDLMDKKSQMMSLISSGLEALEGLVDVWQSAQRQRAMIRRRLARLLTVTQRASDFNAAFYFGEPMQSPWGVEVDIVYGLGRLRYFKTLGWGDKISNEGDLHRLDQEKAAIY